MSTYHLNGVLISDYMSRGTHAFPRFANVLSFAFLRTKADTALLGLIGTCQFPNIRSWSPSWPVLCNNGLSWRTFHSVPYDFLTY
jgi:hypothetical protein